MKFQVNTNGVCAYSINFEIEGDKVKNISFDGGCNGNLKAISKAVDGKSADEIYNLFSGITCGYKETSCSDQLARAVKKAYEEMKK